MKTAILAAGTAALTVGAFFGVQSERSVEGPVLAQGPAAEYVVASVNGKMWSNENAQADSRKGATCNRQNPGAWEAFEVNFTNTEVTFKSINTGLYVSSNNGVGAVSADRTSAQGWEKFFPDTTSSRNWVFIGNNGKLISSENGTRTMRCNRNPDNTQDFGPFGRNTWEHFRWGADARAIQNDQFGFNF